MFKNWLKIFLRNNTTASIALIVFGSIVWSLTMVKSGLVYSYGMGFWGPNGHDGVWHIALIESLSKGTWQMPVFAGEIIKNYHIGFDLLVAWIHKITLIPVNTLYFQIIPPILALFIGIFSYKFVYTWRRSKPQAFWATFFVYFGGSLGWIVTLFRNGNIGGESLFWSQQSISTLINPPFALSILLMFLGLQLLIKGVKRNDKKLLTTVTFIFGILIQIKVYAGLLTLGALLLAGLWNMLKRRGITVIKVFTGSLVISLLLFLPVSREASATVVFKPFWFLETMMGFSDRFYWPRFAEAMVNYKLAGNLIKGIPAYTVAFFIFIIGNFGIRLVKDIWIFKKLKDFKNLYFVDVFVFSVITAGIILPMFFIQKGTPWNTIQFMYYSLMFSGVLVGIALGEFIERISITVVQTTVVSVVILLTIPTTVATLRHYFPARPPAKLSNEELEALKFLAMQPEGVVLTYPFDQSAANAAVDNPPRPLYLYESTAYVSAFAKKPVYLEDEVNLDITGYDWTDRREKVVNFFDQPNENFISENNIRYVYLVKGLSEKSVQTAGFEKIFVNNEVEIYGLK